MDAHLTKPKTPAVAAALASPGAVAADYAEKLHRFLNAAAGDGLLLDGVDAADLYVAVFPKTYERAVAHLDAGVGAVAAEPTGWMPIETAPKDKLILLYGAKRMEFAVGMHHSRDGWVSDSTAEFLSMYQPTHWKELPRRPSTQGVNQ